jgi:translation initiation factor 3 subunit C
MASRLLMSRKEFDKLNRQVVKLVQAGNTPKAYIRAIAELEDFMNARGLNAVKQRIKKNNKDFQKDIDAYKADKDGFMESEEEEDVPVPKTKKPKTVPGALDLAFDDDDAGFSTVGKGGRTLQFTPESILKHLRTIMESRGKKNTDRTEQIKIMEKLYEVATTPYQRVRVLLTLISTRFDLSTGVQTFMSQEQWKAAEQEFGNLLKVLESNRELVVIENAEEWEDDDKAPTIVEGEKFKIPGSVVSYVERLDDELTRSLQHIDPHTAEYIDRLSDEGALYNNIVRTLLYTESLKKDESLQVPQDSLNRIVMRRLEHVYFKVSKLDFFRGPRLTSYSQQQLSKFWKKIVGSRSPPHWTLLLLLAAKCQMPLLWLTSSATTSLSIAKASSVLELCFARYTSLLCMTITTRLAI